MYHVDPAPRHSKSALLNVISLLVSIGLAGIQHLLMAFTTVSFSALQQALLMSGLGSIVLISALMLYGQHRLWPFRRLVSLACVNGLLWVLVYPTGSIIIRMLT
jgi:hypothetical protein